MKPQTHQLLKEPLNVIQFTIERIYLKPDALPQLQDLLHAEQNQKNRPDLTNRLQYLINQITQ